MPTRARNLRLQPPEAVNYYPLDLKPSQRPLHIIAGPPCSGKSQYVTEHAKPDDLIIDLDEIGSSQQNTSRHNWSRTGLKEAITRRNNLLRLLSQPSDTHAWFIISAASAADRKWWANQLKPQEMITLDTPQAECLERLKHDPERPLLSTQDAIYKWFEKYTPDLKE